MPKSSRNVLRIDPANAGPVWFAIITTGLVVLASFVLSFAALSTLASWMALPGYLGFLVPIFIDIAIVVFTYSAIAARAEGERSWRPWMWVALWTTVSSAANGAHAWFYGPQGYEGIAGAILAALIPIGSLLGTHEIADRIIIRPGRDVPVQPSVYTANPTRTRSTKTSKPVERKVSNPNRQVSSKAAKQLTADTGKAVQPDTAPVHLDTPAPVQVDTTSDTPVDTSKAVQRDALDAELDTLLDTALRSELDTMGRDQQIVYLDTMGWAKTKIAAYTKVSRQTVYDVLSKNEAAA